MNLNHHCYMFPRLAATLLVVGIALVRPGFSEELAGKRSEDGQTTWYDVRQLGMEGQGFTETKAPFDRLPARAEGVVRDAVWNLSRHSAGIAVRFQTDARTIAARWTLTSSTLAMQHMPATGVSGLDLYVLYEGQWRWLANGRPAAQANESTLVAGLAEGFRQYCLYLPLYNGVSEVEIGLPADAKLESLARPADRMRPIVFYGTSITQGGCASRPGMVHTAILGRRLDWPVINLGFSGNGRMELEVADFIGEIDAAIYVIDCLPNMDATAVGERTVPLVKRLRTAAPRTPILLVEDRTYTNAFLITSKQERHRTARHALRQAFEQLRGDGVEDLYYLTGPPQVGDDSEATVDSSHPTDLGFFRMAAAFEPVLREILRLPSK